MEGSWIERAIALAIAGILGAVVALSVRLPGWLWSPNAPAWVQAVGAILAIAATGLIATWQMSHESRRRDMEARVLARDHAMMISRSIHEWNARAKSWQTLLDDPDGMGDWVLISNLSDQADGYAVPGDILALVGNFRHLGGAGLALQRAVIAWQRVDGEQSTARQLWAGGPYRIPDDPQADVRVLEAIAQYTASVLIATMLVDGILSA